MSESDGPLILSCPPPDANQAAARTRGNGEVRPFERVPIFTVRFRCINSRWAGAAQDILTDRYRLQVLWPHAKASAAEVVKGHAVRNGADQQFVGKAMGIYDIWVHDSELAISPGDSACPKPAGFSLSNLSPKALLYRHASIVPQGQWIARVLPALIVKRAPSIPLDRLRAIYDLAFTHSAPQLCSGA